MQLNDFFLFYLSINDEMSVQHAQNHGQISILSPPDKAIPIICSMPSTRIEETYFFLHPLSFYTAIRAWKQVFVDNLKSSVMGG